MKLERLQFLLNEADSGCRPAPLPPLGASLRELCTLCEDTEAKVQKLVTAGQWSDFTFELGRQHIPVHQAILAARSLFFRQVLRSGAIGQKVGVLLSAPSASKSSQINRWTGP